MLICVNTFDHGLQPKIQNHKSTIEGGPPYKGKIAPQHQGLSYGNNIYIYI